MEANAFCIAQNSNLMSVQDIHERLWVRTQIGTEIFWFGLNDQVSENVFEWSDGSTFIPYLSYWMDGQPDNWGDEPGEDCGQVVGESQGQWNDENCNVKRKYICKHVNRKSTSTCDLANGWRQYGSNCYKLKAETRKSWSEARGDCVQEGGDLVSIISAEEEEYVTGTLDPSWADLWIGLSTLLSAPWLAEFRRQLLLDDKNQDGDFKWVDKSPITFSNYLPGWPKNTVGTWDCGQIFTDSHCDAGYLLYVDFCYHFETEQVKNWHDAEAHCSGEQSHLVSFHSLGELSFITAHMPGEAWVGLNDIHNENQFVWIDGTAANLLPWAPNQPDNWQNNEDCVNLRGMNQHEPGLLNDDFCTATKEFICKKGWNPKCGSWMSDPFNDYCYLVNYLSTRMWAEARADCVNQGGDLLSITDPFEQAFIQGNPDDYYGEDCLSILINNGYWNDDNCDSKRGYICERRGKTPEPPPPHDGFMTALVCQDSSAVLHCPTESVINIQSAFYGRKSADICPHLEGSGGSCTVDGILPYFRKRCDNHPFCFLYAHTEEDPCPTVSKYLEIVYSCEQKATSSWIQANLGQTRKVTGVVIQGCPQNEHWITKFKIQHSMDGTTWTDYTADGQSFPGSTDKNSPVTQLLGTPVTTQYIRVLLLEFNGQAGLRFDVLGCTPDSRCSNTYHRVYGTSVYRGDSNICAAAIHAGVVLNENGGDCTLLKAPGQNFYAGSTRNGITSLQYDGNYAVSYTFADGELRCSGLDWYEFGDFCYKPFEDKKTWHDAQRTCRAMGAELVSILSMTEQSWLESYLYMATSDVWTGLTDLVVTGMFTWSDEHMVTFTYWAPGEPNNHDGFHEDCVEMLYQTGRWNDVSCTELNTYICKTPKAHYPLPSVKPTVYGCPQCQGWDSYGYACYWMEETGRTWSEAKAFCEEQDSFVLHIGDIYEQSHFTVALSGKTGFWWIGLRARGGSSGGVDYIWDNGALLSFTHWDKNQPDSGDGTCVAMTTGTIGGFWDDKECLEKHAFVCEKPRPNITPPTKAPTFPPSQGCATSWTALPHFRNCFKLFHNVDWSMKKSWEAALEDCVSRGANLVSIHTQEEEEFLALYSKGTSKWIGLKHNPAEGGHSWSDGTPLSHTNWGHGEPNNHEGREECVEMVSSTNGTFSEWNDLNCDAHQDWICMIAKGKNPILPPVPPPPDPAPDCGANPGWRKNNNICYYYNDTDIVDFHTAMRRCYEEKASLVSILNKDEQAYVNTMVGTGQVASAWIGMRMFGITGGQYMWVDFSPLAYTHWSPGEPNNANGEEQCVQMNRLQGGWNDANCGRAGAGYVCKKIPGDIHTPPPPTQPWEGNCPEGWMRFKDKCFMFKGKTGDIKANWSFARSWCKEQGGDLAVIDDQYENDFVSSYLRDLKLPTWIGLSDLLLENQYAWSDGVSPVLYTNWNDKEPNNAGGAVRILYNTTSSINPPPPTKAPCPTGYTSWYLNCYRLAEEPATWDAAQAACRDEGGNLASIDMSYDQAFVAGAVLQGRADAWIGLRRKVLTGRKHTMLLPELPGN
ncbi:hypothetical protein F7725_015675 [Dissostichus mawsoni]|uniref:Macrophage mannose receptor 1-like n=1 Tax=Dissostichus mawsoni TaxID=36200 RepID=A0A7J5YLJ6_DISMA|nr:hypothetical protein F7725_015675 [Dissostichus mawsoni]